MNSGALDSSRGAPGLFKEEVMKKAYSKPVLRRLGLLRQVTRFSF
jgi:hypothetical protein